MQELFAFTVVAVLVAIAGVVAQRRVGGRLGQLILIAAFLRILGSTLRLEVIEHAYGGATDRTVEIRFEDRGPALCVDVVDNGAKVDLRSVPRVDIERYVSERRTGGLGVHLMEKIMDSVTFRRSARRNVCCLVKRKAGPAGS